MSCLLLDATPSSPSVHPSLIKSTEIGNVFFSLSSHATDLDLAVFAMLFPSAGGFDASVRSSHHLIASC